MKNIFILLIALFTLNARGQITLEYTHDSASTYASGNPAVSSQLMIIKFEVSGEQYVNVNRWGKYISIYSMNHSLVQTISLANITGNTSSGNGVGDVLYLSETLFNTDSKKEFMYITDIAAPNVMTRIYNEDGNLLFSDTGAAVIRTNVQLQQYPIYNTSVGTKMILSYGNGQAKVFALGGTLSNSIASANQNLLNQNALLANAYPNPTSNSTTVAYQLPANVNEGEIVFYDLQGNEIKRFRVDRSFTSLLISTSDIAAGTYYYQLQTSNNASAGKQLVVIK